MTPGVRLPPRTQAKPGSSGLRMGVRSPICHCLISIWLWSYSGFNFSHYDLPLPTRYCIPYVRSGLYQLVIRVKGFRVCALHCARVPLRPRK